MSRLFNKPMKFNHPQSGLALTITLILLLVLMMMSAGIAYVGAIHSDISNAVENKPLALNASESCLDQATSWLSTTAGQTWVRGAATPTDLAAVGQPLYGKNLYLDSLPSGVGDTRSSSAIGQLSKAIFNSCVIEKLAATTARGTGGEIGTTNGYGVSNMAYTLRITATGNYNVVLSSGSVSATYWQPSSTKTVLQAVFDYTP